jgi:hypothetical protein
MIRSSRKKMAIITSYFKGESYGLLGPQMAATVIQEKTSYECIVIAVTREDDKVLLKKALADYFGVKKPIIGFSTLSGREDLFSFAKELKDDEAVTILAGPQADVDYSGEKGWRDYPHRFKGLSENFSFALHGPAEQVVRVLQDLDGDEWKTSPGVLFQAPDGVIIRNHRRVWDPDYLGTVRWNNIYKPYGERLVPLRVTTGQVLQHIGCPHAAASRWAEVDYPVSMNTSNTKKVKLPIKGCSFCDVAVDKGFHGALGMETVLNQIQGLPESADGRKIPFELINENPLPGLPLLLKELGARGNMLSKISLIMRADWFLSGERYLRKALKLVKDMGLLILLSSMGFESFDDAILKNLNKGVNVETNLHAIRLMRQLKDEFPDEWAYSRAEGSIHGFIHPTPWDTEETNANLQMAIDRYYLAPDILPEHSIPLIIHHASALGDWIREIENREGARFARHVSTIGWWQEGDRFLL